jgi:hypothetical protein
MRLKTQIKPWEQKLATSVYNHSNICNILIYFCNIRIKHLQHTYKHLKHLKHTPATCVFHPFFWTTQSRAENGRFRPADG